jgi:hypothetical protein
MTVNPNSAAPKSKSVAGNHTLRNLTRLRVVGDFEIGTTGSPISRLTASHDSAPDIENGVGQAHPLRTRGRGR